MHVFSYNKKNNHLLIGRFLLPEGNSNHSLPFMTDRMPCEPAFALQVCSLWRLPKQLRLYVWCTVYTSPRMIQFNSSSSQCPGRHQRVPISTYQPGGGTTNQPIKPQVDTNDQKKCDEDQQQKKHDRAHSSPSLSHKTMIASRPHNEGAHTHTPSRPSSVSASSAEPMTKQLEIRSSRRHSIIQQHRKSVTTT